MSKTKQKQNNKQEIVKNDSNVVTEQPETKVESDENSSLGEKPETKPEFKSEPETKSEINPNVKSRELVGKTVLGYKVAKDLAVSEKYASVPFDDDLKVVGVSLTGRASIAYINSEAITLEVTLGRDLGQLYNPSIYVL